MVRTRDVCDRTRSPGTPQSITKKYGPQFLCIEMFPIASASIASVHLGYLMDGTKVAVKIQYPWLGAP